MSLKNQEETVYAHVQQGMASPCPLRFWKHTEVEWPHKVQAKARPLTTLPRPAQESGK